MGQLVSLTTEENDDLRGYEAIIERGRKTFIEVGAALQEIRDQRLYRETHDTFEAYVEGRWQMSRPRAYEYIEAAAVVIGVSAMADTPLPANERQARELGRVAPEERPAVWREAVSRAGGQPAPARLVAEVAEDLGWPQGVSRAEYKDWRGDRRSSDEVNPREYKRLRDAGLIPGVPPHGVAAPDVPGDQAPREPIARGEREILAMAKTIRQAAIVQKRDERTAMHRAVAEGNRDLDFGDMRFAVVEGDPPWSFGNEGVNGAAGGHYPLMSTEAICALPVAGHCLENAICFLWVPNALLPDGLAVLAAWGFDYKTAEAWDKGDDNNGTGFYDKQDHEQLLIGVRGGGMTPVVRFSSIIRAAKSEHSEKPPIAYERIEAMFPDAPRLSLFRRAPREGWTAWGNQAEGQEVSA